jgi:hypothetical protein
MPSYRLGAEELIELGRARNAQIGGRKPFFVNRPKLSGRGLGDILDLVKSVGGFIASGLGYALTTLGDLVNIPVSVLSQGVDITFNGVSGLLENVPVIGDLLAEILVLGGTVIKFALSIPGLLLTGLGNIMSGIGKALSAKGTSSENEKKVKDAKDNIVSKAPAAQQDAVRQVLDSAGVAGDNLTPTMTPTSGASTEPGLSSLEKALMVGIPVIGVAALVLLAR